MEQPERIGVLGSGAWATCLCCYLAEQLPDALIDWWIRPEEQWEGKGLGEIVNYEQHNPKYLPGVRIPDSVIVTYEASIAAMDKELVVPAVPSPYLAGIMPSICEADDSAIFLHGIKGLVESAGGPQTVSSFISDSCNIPRERIATLSGPTIAHEFAYNLMGVLAPVSATLAGKSQEKIDYLSDILTSRSLVITKSNDITGTELCGCLKQVYAFTIGAYRAMVEESRAGLVYAANTECALLHVAGEEMFKILECLKRTEAYADIKENTFRTPAGFADLLVSAKSGRNSMAGSMWIRERAYEHDTSAGIDRCIAELGGGYPEAFRVAKHVHDLISSAGFAAAAPILGAAYRLMYEHSTPEHELGAILSIRPTQRT